MNGFDLAIIVVVLLFGAIGALRGFMRELMAAVAWATSLVCSWLLADKVATRLPHALVDPLLRRMIAFFGLLIAVWLAMTIVAFLLRKLLFPGSLTGSERALGAVVGAARGVVVVLVIVLLAGLTPLPKEPWWQESRLAGYFEQVATRALTLLPLDVARQFSYR